MPLTRIPLELELTAPPRRVCLLIASAQTGIERFLDSHWKHPVPGFHPSDFRMVYHALLWLRGRFSLQDQLFCEWGSGFGVVAGLAGLLGCRAYGIETDEDLVRAGRRLADKYDLPTQFFHGSFLPNSARNQEFMADSLAWLDTTTRSAYGEIGLDPADFAVIYAYPWPGEEQVIFQLFDEYAAPGALLLTYHGSEDLRLHQKNVSRRGNPSRGNPSHNHSHSRGESRSRSQSRKRRRR